jgi:hypothetical protein
MWRFEQVEFPLMSFSRTTRALWFCWGHLLAALQFRSIESSETPWQNDFFPFSLLPS